MNRLLFIIITNALFGVFSSKLGFTVANGSYWVMCAAFAVLSVITANALFKNET